MPYQIRSACRFSTSTHAEKARSIVSNISGESIEIVTKSIARPIHLKRSNHRLMPRVESLQGENTSRIKFVVAIKRYKIPYHLLCYLHKLSVTTLLIYIYVFSLKTLPLIVPIKFNYYYAPDSTNHIYTLLYMYE